MSDRKFDLQRNRFQNTSESALNADRDDIGVALENQITDHLAGTYIVTIEPINDCKAKVSAFAGDTTGDQKLLTWEILPRRFYTDRDTCNVFAKRAGREADDDIATTTVHTLLEYFDELYARFERTGLKLFDPNVWKVLSVSENVVIREAGEEPLSWEQDGYDRFDRTITITLVDDGRKADLTLSEDELQPDTQTIHEFKTRFFSMLYWTPTLSVRQWRSLVEEWHERASNATDQEEGQ